jgi:hypothetical protein
VQLDGWHERLRARDDERHLQTALPTTVQAA